MVALSTMEAESITSSLATQEATYIKILFEELTGRTFQIKLYIDNASALKFIDNIEAHKRTKHIDIRYHYIKSKQMDKTTEPLKINRRDQMADIFTKGLPAIQYRRLRAECEIIELDS